MMRNTRTLSLDSALADKISLGYDNAELLAQEAIEVLWRRADAVSIAEDTLQMPSCAHPPFSAVAPSTRDEKTEMTPVPFLLLLLSSPGLADSKPNVVFILADDLGWSDTTLYGTTKLYETPNIERLAARGMTFTRAYSSSPLCSPTRASILTGLSPARHGITSPNCHLPTVVLQATPVAQGPPSQKATIPHSVSRLDTPYYTLAEALKDHGYTTGHFGKWHLGAEPYSPLQQGFDIDLPHHPGPGPAGSYVAPWKFKDFDHDPDVPDQHIEDRMAAEAVAFMEQHKDEPFFLNYWMFSVHAPFDAKQALIDEYRKKVQPERSATLTYLRRNDRKHG